MMAAVHRYGGYVAQSTGDGIFALFGAPVAHEDHPQRPRAYSPVSGEYREQRFKFRLVPSAACAPLPGRSRIARNKSRLKERA
jgi:class 3 adenylate cyclase